MGYVEDSLGANEKIHYIAHFPLISYAFAYGALILSIVIGAVSYNGGYAIAAFLPVLIGVVIFLSILVPIWTTQIGVTNQRLIYKRGFIQRETQEMQLRTIEGVSLDQDVLGRIFGYGKLQIEGTGNDKVFLPSIGAPLAMRRALQDAIGDVQNATAPNGRGVAAQVT